MMKKRVVLVLLAMILGGCTNVVPKTPENGSSNNDPVISDTDTSGINKEEDKQDESNVSGTQAISRNDYIRDTFADYGFTAPAENEWIVNDEGPQKVAVIIKENVKNGKPNISKIVFLEGDTNEILFLQVNNKIIIKG